MGGQRFDPTDYADYSVKTRTKSQSQTFASVKAPAAVTAANITIRESVDSTTNPASTPIIVLVDDTGSMGYLAKEIVQNGLGVIMADIYDKKPVSDPHILVGVVGDAFSDTSPLQVSQFEAGVTPLTQQIESLYLEGNGGGNGGESYILAWYFAAYKTKTDAKDKRNKKGYLFTIGDEPPHLNLTRDQIKRVFNDDVEADFSAQSLLDLVSQDWEVFHLKVTNRTSFPTDRWVTLLGERLIIVDDHTRLGEVITSTIRVIEGEPIKDVVASWSGDTSLVVSKAISALAKRPGNEVVEL